MSCLIGLNSSSAAISNLAVVLCRSTHPARTPGQAPFLDHGPTTDGDAPSRNLVHVVEDGRVREGAAREERDVVPRRDEARRRRWVARELALAVDQAQEDAVRRRVGLALLDLVLQRESSRQSRVVGWLSARRNGRGREGARGGTGGGQGGRGSTGGRTSLLSMKGTPGRCTDRVSGASRRPPADAPPLRHRRPTLDSSIVDKAAEHGKMDWSPGAYHRAPPPAPRCLSLPPDC